ncbi:beta-N-acetylhexosaminidase family protein [Neolewinella antarctica]|uniref:Uncharacterized protein n=1 Tax=Neolewinella antarctica TaxID=442734 RepID=A0ABX0XFM4_9BACT|nr:hypothetical protein [Neolewinella antarctica]NJC28120.1 hypothetical protein [Neolewinella antarctica]
MRSLLFVLLAVSCFACGDGAPPPPAMAPLNALPLDPLPFEMSGREGYLWIDPAAKYDLSGADAGAVDYLKSKGYGNIPLTTYVDEELMLPDEAYLLDISPEGITITSPAPVGVLTAAKALVQIIDLSPNTGRGIFLPAGTVLDQPMQ